MTDQGKQYASFIEAELKAEYDRRAAVNTRAAAAITAATGLVTVVTGVFAVLSGAGDKGVKLSGWPRLFLVAALVALLGAALCAVCAGLPWQLKLTDPTTLNAMLTTQWADSEEAARKATAYANAVTIESLRRGTNIKGWFLTGAGACQIIAVAALALCTLAFVA